MRPQIRLILDYAFGLFPANLLFSFLTGVVALVGMGNAPAFALATFATSGFIGAAWFHARLHPGERYFYHNLGLSRTRLLAGAWAVHAALALGSALLLGVARFPGGGG